MTPYQPPLRDIRFALHALAGLEAVAALPAFAGLNPALADAVLEEGGRLAAEVLAPLNRPGDAQGARLDGEAVITPPGFADAYRRFVEGGWNGLSAPVEFGGQGLPELLGAALYEMWNAANMAFTLCPMLTAAAVAALQAHGSPAQQALYLPRLVSGEWTGTMVLTEPQAGSDLAAVRARAVPEGDHYRLYGQKIFITWGDHDMAENIVHMVLARTPDAPPGVKGISLFLVPKYLPDGGGPGRRNDVRCLALEHKLGIHASPTCVLAFGDRDGAVGWLVGEKNQGLAHMFTMMNEARLKVGSEGLGLAQGAYQQALAYARQRVQGQRPGAAEGQRVTLIHHPDVRRMLLAMKCQTEAMRALGYVAAMHLDLARHHPDAAARRAHRARVELLTPIAKGWCTEVGFDLTSLGVQVHGGMGYIEEAGVCQYLRDARITTIYEGTTGIQALDLVRRKLPADRGAAMAALLADMRAVAKELATADAELAVIRAALEEGIRHLDDASRRLLAAGADAVLAQAVNYLLLAGYVCGGWQLARAALAARRRLAAGADADFYRARLVSARFYAEQILPRAGALAAAVASGATATLALDEAQF
ncbi:MAG: acyl-CoA dehydrogenase [Pseudomonadota bacterium]|nr:acyl-CoA dehydrogenase [Pseudomonadota bacterium]